MRVGADVEWSERRWEAVVKEMMKVLRGVGWRLGKYVGGLDGEGECGLEREGWEGLSSLGSYDD